MDKARRRAAEYCLLWLSVLFAGASVAAWYSYVFHGAQASWMVFTWMMIILATGPIALWLINYSKWHQEFSPERVFSRVWCGLIFGWVGYLLIAGARSLKVANGPIFEPWILVGCLVALVLVWLWPVLVKLVRARRHKH